MTRKILKKGMKKSVSVSNYGSTTTTTRNNSHIHQHQVGEYDDAQQQQRISQQQKQQQPIPIQDVYDAIQSCFENGNHIVDCLKKEQYEFITELIIQNKTKYNYHDTTSNTNTHANRLSFTQPYPSPLLLSSSSTTTTALPTPMTTTLMNCILDEHIDLICTFLRTVCDKIHIEKLQCNDCKCIHTIGTTVNSMTTTNTSTSLSTSTEDSSNVDAGIGGVHEVDSIEQQQQQQKSMMKTMISNESILKLIRVTRSTLNELDLSNNISLFDHPMKKSSSLIEELIAHNTTHHSFLARSQSDHDCNYGYRTGLLVVDVDPDENDMADPTITESLLSTSRTRNNNNNNHNNNHTGYHLVSLNLSYNNLVGKKSKFIASLIRNTCTIQTLRLKGNSFGRQGIKKIADALSENGTITCLDLSNNEMDDKCIKLLMDSFSKRKTKTTSASSFVRFQPPSMNRNNDYVTWDDHMNDNDHYSNNNASCIIQSLDVSNNQITDVGIEYIAKADLFLKNIISFNISSNRIQSDGAEQMGYILKYSRTIQQLYIGKNHLGIHIQHLIYGMNHIACTTSLQILDLSWNQINDETIQIIAEMLRTNCTIQTLNIANNKMSNSGCIVLCKVLVNDNHTIKDINISGNQISNPFPLIELFCQHSNFRSLDNDDHDDQRRIPNVDYKDNNFTRIDQMKIHYAATQYQQNKIDWFRTMLLKVKSTTKPLRSIHLYEYQHSDEEIITLSALMTKYKNMIQVKKIYIGYCHHGMYGGGNERGGVQTELGLVTDRGWKALMEHIYECNIEKIRIEKRNSNKLMINHHSTKKSNNGSNTNNNNDDNDDQSISSVQTTKHENMKELTTIEELYIQNSRNITINGIESLCKALVGNVSIKVLFLSDCNIQSNGAKRLYEALKENQIIQRVTVSKNHIGDDGAQYIFRLLQYPDVDNQQTENVHTERNGLISLNVSDNSLTDIAMSYLPCNRIVPTLDALYLDENHITDVGVLDLGKFFMQYQRSLKKISITKNLLSNKGIQILEMCFHYHTTETLCNQHSDHHRNHGSGGGSSRLKGILTTTPQRERT